MWKIKLTRLKSMHKSSELIGLVRYLLSDKINSQKEEELTEKLESQRLKMVKILVGIFKIKLDLSIQRSMNSFSSKFRELNRFFG